MERNSLYPYILKSLERMREERRQGCKDKQTMPKVGQVFCRYNNVNVRLLTKCDKECII